MKRKLRCFILRILCLKNVWHKLYIGNKTLEVFKKFLEYIHVLKVTRDINTLVTSLSTISIFISYLLSTLLFFPFLLSLLYFSAHFVGTQYPNYWQKCRQFWEFLWWDWDQHPSKTNPIDVAKYWSHLGQIYHLFSTSVL